MTLIWMFDTPEQRSGTTSEKRHRHSRPGGGHKSNIKNRNQAGTALSAKIWELKDAGRNYEIKNKIVRKAHPYKTGDAVCDLCLTEKTCIVLGHKAPPELFLLPSGCGLLNVRDEVLGHCPHKLKYKLIGRKPRKKQSS